MGAIDQYTKADRVVFSPSTKEADLWMRRNYDAFDTSNVTLTFSLPAEVEDAQAFRAEAEKNGFTISFL